MGVFSVHASLPYPRGLERMSSSCDEESCDEAVKTTPGIVYLSSVPPFMKPHKVRHLLSPYGSVGRVYLQPEGKHSTHTTHTHYSLQRRLFDRGV